MAAGVGEQLDKLDGVLHVIKDAASDAHIERMSPLAQISDEIAEQEMDIFEAESLFDSQAFEKRERIPLDRGDMSGAGPKQMSRVACFERTEFQDLLAGNVDGAEKAMNTSVVEEVDRTAGKPDLNGQLRKPLILKQSGDF